MKRYLKMTIYTGIYSQIRGKHKVIYNVSINSDNVGSENNNNNSNVINIKIKMRYSHW